METAFTRLFSRLIAPASISGAVLGSRLDRNCGHFQIPSPPSAILEKRRCEQWLTFTVERRAATGKSHG